MAIVLTDNKHYKNIADVMRSNSVHNKLTKFQPEYMSTDLQTIFDDRTEQDWGDGWDVGYEGGYDDGYEFGLSEGNEQAYNQGYDSGYDNGLGDGATEEYNKFWDAFQDNGNRVNYRHAFYGLSWNDTNFNPKYELKPTVAASMFQSCRVQDSDLLRLNMENITDATSMFQNCYFTSLNIYLPAGSYSKANMFQGVSYLRRLELQVVEGTTFDKTMFAQNGMATYLTNLIVSGDIRNNNFDVHEHPSLNVASLRSILKALLTAWDDEHECYSPLEKTGLSITLATAHRTKIEGDATCSEYLQAATSLGWTIAYL